MRVASVCAARRWASDVKFDTEGKVAGAKYSVGMPDLDHIDHLPVPGLVDICGGSYLTFSCNLNRESWRETRNVQEEARL